MIELCGIRKSYRSPGGGTVKALDGVSLNIGKGDIYGVIGYSGAGKSTLVRCVNFLETPDEGRVTVEGFGAFESRSGTLYFTPEGESRERPAAEADLRNLRRGVGMIFQHFNLLDRSTVFENVAYPLRHTGRSEAQIEARVLELLELVELADKADNYPSQLSGGQKQRVAIARALANDPKILLSDEATSALDPDVTESILSLLKSLNKRLGLTIIMITHDLGVVAQLCDEIIVMYAGSICEQGNADEIFYNPSHEYTKGLLRSIPEAGARRERLEPIAGTPIDLLNMPAGCPFAPRCDGAMKICLTRPPENILIEGSHISACWRNFKTAAENGIAVIEEVQHE